MCWEHGGGKPCTEKDCTNAAVDSSGKCRTHGGGPRCEVCDKPAWDSQKKRCMLHGGGPICSEPGCDKSADRKGKCFSHGHLVCSVQDCEKSAKRPSDKCIAHGGGYRCTEEDCENSAVDGSGKCRTHGGGPRCEVCGKPAYSKTKRCYLHGGAPKCSEPDCDRSTDGFEKCLIHGGGVCSKEGCRKRARRPSDKCKEHGGGKRCPNCIDWIDSRCAHPDYEGYCATCFKRLFPDHEKSKIIYGHTKENLVRNALVANFEGFVHDKVLVVPNCDCTHRRRVDFRKQIGNTILAVEVDEDGHRDYDTEDEKHRYDDLYMAFSAKWIYIRFNPDGKGVDMEDKLSSLMNEISAQIERIENEENSEPVEIIKMFFD